MKHEDAMEMMKLGYNVYLTGPAGSGKTFLLNKFIENLKEKNVAVAITASTGVAATHMGGITLDSWSGIGIRDDLTDSEITEMKSRLHLKIRYLGTKILIIDEVSMVSARKIDLLDKVCRSIRNVDRAFGGIQVVLCGDFFQLPPVGDNNQTADFTFKSNIWKNMDLKICYLEQQHRQNDPQFLFILNSIRNDKVNDEVISLLAKSIGRVFPGNTVPARLYTHNVDVDLINNSELEKIQEKPYLFEMTAKGVPQLTDFLKKSCLSPDKLVLKKGAVVMFVKNNLKEGYVNGTMGKIINFDRQGFPVVQTFSGRSIHVGMGSWSISENNITKAEIFQLPLRLAWAITVHKSQGMTLDEAEIDLSKSFLTGMGYVALSRLKSLKGLRLMGLNELALKVNPEVLLMDNRLQEVSRQTESQLKAMGWWKRTIDKRKNMYRLTS